MAYMNPSMKTGWIKLANMQLKSCTYFGFFGLSSFLATAKTNEGKWICYDKLPIVVNLCVNGML